MKCSRNVPTAVVLCSLCFALVAIPAYGYVDPNATGMASQIVTPLLVIAIACVTFLRKQVGAAFAGLSRRLRGRADV